MLNILDYAVLVSKVSIPKPEDADPPLSSCVVKTKKNELCSFFYFLFGYLSWSLKKEIHLFLACATKDLFPI